MAGISSRRKNVLEKDEHGWVVIEEKHFSSGIYGHIRDTGLQALDAPQCIRLPSHRAGTGTSSRAAQSRYFMTFKDINARASKLGASDLHLESGTTMVARVRGELTALGETLAGQQLMDMARELLSEVDWADFNSRGSVDLSVVVGGIRCRIILYRTVRGLGLAARLLLPTVGNLRSCNLNPELRRLLAPSPGLVLDSGPTGS